MMLLAWLLLIHICITRSFKSTHLYGFQKKSGRLVLQESSNFVTERKAENSQTKSSETTSLSLTVPAETFLESVNQAAVCIRRAFRDGHKLMEVEFPPLSLEYLEDSSSSSQDISSANTKWAIETAKLLSDLGQISIVYPDKVELKQAMRGFSSFAPFKNITLSSVRSDTAQEAGSFDQFFSSLFRSSDSKNIVETPGTTLYLALVSSTQELPDLERLHALNPSIPIVFFNLRLDFLRGDLGLPLFPSRDLHYLFLSKVKPVYLLRSKSFAASIRKPPFIVNYSGLLFRHYPEPYQCFLNIGQQRSRLVVTNDDKPSTAKFREYLTEALRIPGVDAKELQVKGSLLWWEKGESQEASDAWRT